ncbi:helix-turn-helix domain-containing protein [Myxococcus sp. MxC21-1]|uniref:helix-turn-helix domain-containing protein n=1 Tax=Myxococcus sp. MxC21-1 TaxID=3041439 RepID=UPI0029305B3C|nr:helix-turn-helix domain-containing protein [Myxococcus sp. MxC21-1]WNZ60912.1 helix-turn-helix domain-containing protein [Myxococcus sp. MxC21-1]
MAEPDTVVQDLAEHFGLDRTSIWSLCRRYEALGAAAVWDAPRSGRPPRLSPCSSSRLSNWPAVSRREWACT